MRTATLFAGVTVATSFSFSPFLRLSVDLLRVTPVAEIGLSTTVTFDSVLTTFTLISSLEGLIKTTESASTPKATLPVKLSFTVYVTTRISVFSALV